MLYPGVCCGWASEAAGGGDTTVASPYRGSWWGSPGNKSRPWIKALGCSAPSSSFFNLKVEMGRNEDRVRMGQAVLWRVIPLKKKASVSMLICENSTFRSCGLAYAVYTVNGRECVKWVSVGDLMFIKAVWSTVVKCVFIFQKNLPVFPKWKLKMLKNYLKYPTSLIKPLLTFSYTN